MNLQVREGQWSTPIGLSQDSLYWNKQPIIGHLSALMEEELFGAYYHNYYPHKSSCILLHQILVMVHFCIYM